MKRVDAAQARLTTYKPDQACGRGHWRRYTKTGQCVECLRLSQAAYTKRQITHMSGMMQVTLNVYPMVMAQVKTMVDAINLAHELQHPRPAVQQPYHPPPPTPPQPPA